MQRASRKEREQFISLIAQHTGECSEMTSFSFARRLMYYGATYGRVQEMACNAPDFEYDQNRPDAQERNKRREYWWNKHIEDNERKEKRIEEKLIALCAKFSCKPVFGGDPRGNTIKIQVPDGYTNDWGREGICVPTS